MQKTINSIITQNMIFIAIFIIHAVDSVLILTKVVGPDTFIAMQVLNSLNFVGFLIPIIYILNVHRITFKEEAHYTESFA